MNAEEWLSRKGINPIEPIYWEFIESSITLEEVLEQYAEYKQLQNKAPNSDYEKCLELLKECYIDLERYAINPNLCDKIEEHFA